VPTPATIRTPMTTTATFNKRTAATPYA